MGNVVALKSDVEELLARLKKLRTQNSELRVKAVSSGARAENAEIKNRELQDQLSSLLLKNSITEVAGGSRAAKLRITRLIKDIDKCIALSNK